MKSQSTKDKERNERYDKIASAGYPQVVLPFFEGLCRYCGRKGHNKEMCAREAWDAKHGCRLAHACDAHIDFCRERGWPSSRPAAGTFPPFVEGGSAAQSGASAATKSKVKFQPAEESKGAEDKLDRILARMEEMEKVTSNMAGVLADMDGSDDDEGS